MKSLIGMDRGIKGWIMAKRKGKQCHNVMRARTIFDLLFGCINIGVVPLGRREAASTVFLPPPSFFQLPNSAVGVKKRTGEIHSFTQESMSDIKILYSI